MQSTYITVYFRKFVKMKGRMVAVLYTYLAIAYSTGNY